MANVSNMAKVPELRRRILFTLAMIGVFRLGAHVPAPGVDGEALQNFFAEQSGTLFGVFNLFTGGALEQFSIFSLGIMPYISASIILQLLTVVFPYLERLKKEGELGRKKITQYTRYLTVVLSVIQGFMMASFFESFAGPSGQAIVLNPGWAFRIEAVITLSAGTAFLMWLGEQMTERGIGNGISMLIFAGIVAGLPSAISSTFELVSAGQLKPMVLILLLVFMFAVTMFIVFFEQAQRRVPVQYAKRVVGRRMYQGQNTHLPLKLNMSGVIPPIFASALLTFPATISQFSQAEWMLQMTEALSPTGWIYNTLMVGFIIFFAFFYTAIQFDPEEVADNMKKFGGYVPGIRPGKNTAQYILKVLERITLVGSLYLAAVCVVPVFLQENIGIAFYFGGTSLLIVVGVALDTISQIEAHLVQHHYDGFLGAGRARIKGRGGR